MTTLFPHRLHIRLETRSDIDEFVNITSQVNTPVYLEDGQSYRVNAKSILGATAALEWDSLVCVSADDIYQKVRKFVKE